MFTHRAHVVSVAGDAGDAFAEGGDEVAKVVVQHVCQHGAFQVPPQSLDQVEAR